MVYLFLEEQLALGVKVNVYISKGKREKETLCKLISEDVTVTNIYDINTGEKIEFPEKTRFAFEKAYTIRNSPDGGVYLTKINGRIKRIRKDRGKFKDDNIRSRNYSKEIELPRGTKLGLVESVFLSDYKSQ